MLADDFPEHGSARTGRRSRARRSSSTCTSKMPTPPGRRPWPPARRPSMPLADMFWGDRYGQVEDPFGHRWSIATHKRDMNMEQMQEAHEGIHAGRALRGRPAMKFMVIVKASAASEAGVMPAGSCSPRWASSTKNWSRPACCWPAKACTRAAAARASAWMATSAPWSTVPSPNPRSWSPASGSSRSARWTKRSTGCERCPHPHGSGKAEHRDPPDLRGPEDFGDALTPELREQEAALRARVDGQ